MRLVDADALMDFYLRIPTEEFLCERRFTALNVASKIHGEPTVDPVKHGHWNHAHYCSKCGRAALSYVRELREVLDYDCISNGGFEAVVSYYETGWCPHCGAKMDSEVRK